MGRPDAQLEVRTKASPPNLRLAIILDHEEHQKQMLSSPAAEET